MEKRAFCCVGLVNPKSPENVGSVMRAAGCYGVDEVYYTGNRFELARRFATDTKQMVEKIPLLGVDDLLQFMPEGCVPVVVDSDRRRYAAPRLCPSGARFLYLRAGGWHARSRSLWRGERCGLCADQWLYESGGLGQCDPL